MRFFFDIFGLFFVKLTYQINLLIFKKTEILSI